MTGTTSLGSAVPSETANGRSDARSGSSVGVAAGISVVVIIISIAAVAILVVFVVVAVRRKRRKTKLEGNLIVNDDISNGVTNITYQSSHKENFSNPIYQGNTCSPYNLTQRHYNVLKFYIVNIIIPIVKINLT